MKTQIRFPIRFKFLITLLFVVTVVVGLITFTMADLFHKDKTAYIHDLISVSAIHTAEETRSQLSGYEARLRIYALLLRDERLPESEKVDMVRELVEGFEGFVAITTYDEDGRPLSTLYDDRVLEQAGVSKSQLLNYREAHPLPWKQLRSGAVFVENSTLRETLPTLTLAIADTTRQGDCMTVAAVLQLDDLLKLAYRSRAFSTFVVDSRKQLLVNADRRAVAAKATPDWYPDLPEEGAPYSVGMTQDFDLDGVEMVGGVAPVGIGGVVAGVQIPKSAAYVASRELLKNLAAISLALLIASAVLSLFWSRRITRSIEHLSQATRAVAQGQFDVHVQVESRDEIGSLANSFNQMASELLSRDSALQEAQIRLIQSEKMAAFGQLGAGIAHEVKNPLAGILGCAQLSLKTVEKGTMQETNLQLIEKETRRCKAIIENLLKFARQEKIEKAPTQVATVVDDAVAIVRHQLELNQVSLEKEVGEDLPPILGSANQLQQVLMNLMINAQQTMAGKPGSVKISAQRAGGQIEIRVADTGPGIPEENRTKIFEPFFTTKPSGKGTGLGLSVSYAIVEDHGGAIRIESEVGVGTTFILTFPMYAQPGAIPETGEGELRKAG